MTLFFIFVYFVQFPVLSFGLDHYGSQPFIQGVESFLKAGVKSWEQGQGCSYCPFGAACNVTVKL